MEINAQLLKAVEEQVFNHLEGRYPDGFKEHELLKLLSPEVDSSQPKSAPFCDNYDSPHDLFKAHFFLFHVLYRLKQKLITQGRYSLEIHALDIRLLPWQKRTNSEAFAITESDPLANYYLDITQLIATTEDQVNLLLDRFYKGLLGEGRRHEALSILGLADPVDDLKIKHRYRQLAMQHHPDRGGCEEKLKEIHQAVEWLLG